VLCVNINTGGCLGGLPVAFPGAHTRQIYHLCACSFSQIYHLCACDSSITACHFMYERPFSLVYQLL